MHYFFDTVGKSFLSFFRAYLQAHGGEIKKNPARVIQFLWKFVESLAEFADKHDVFLPEISFTAGVVEVSVSFKRVAKKEDKPVPKEPA